MDDGLEERIEALERTVADGEFDHELSDHAERAQRLSAVESQLEAIEARVEEVEAATQALRGYVGNIRAVNDDVEQRANAALAKAEALESTVGELEQTEAAQPTPTGENAIQTTPAADPTDSDRVAATETGEKKTSRCQACGRTHDSEGEADAKSNAPPGATDGGLSHAAGHNPGQTTDESVVPDESDGTGTLQRIREML